MAKSRGLGRGLDALIPTSAMPVEEAMPSARHHDGESVIKLSLADIDPNREQPRKQFDIDRKSVRHRYATSACFSL